MYDNPLGNIPGHNTTDSVQATWKGSYHFEHLFWKGSGHKRTFKVNLVHSRLPREILANNFEVKQGGF